jgi:NAD(P)H-nitrite reductase large subunit
VLGLVNYVIVGNGPAGIRASETIRKNDVDSEIHVISEEKHLYYYRRLLARFIAGKYKPEHLRVYPPNFYEKNGIKQLLGTSATRILAEKKTLQLNDGREIPYDKLLLAVGGNPIIPNWPGCNMSGVMTVRTLDEAQKMVEYITKAKRATVVGGGLLGLNMAEALRQRNLDVTLLVRGDRLWSTMLDKKASDIITKRLEKAAIHVNFMTNVECFTGNDSVSTVKTKEQKDITCELVAVCVGIKPNTRFLEGSGIKTDRGILVNERMETNIEDVYAAGDVAQAYDVVYKDYRLNTNWNNALEQGTIAGSNMAGGNETYCGGVCSNTEKVYDIALTSIGVVAPPSSEYEVLEKDLSEKNAYKKFVLRHNKIVGALFVGDTRDTDAIERLVRTESDVTNIKAKLLRGLKD